MPIQVNDTTVIDDSRNLQNIANSDASFVPYSNSASSLTATDVQAAIDEVVVDLNALSFQADAISYDPSGVSITATDAQGAIDQLCTLPTTTKSANYTLAATDTGGLVSISSGTITVPPNVFSAGDVVVVYNNATTARTIARGSGVTLYWVDGENADRSLIQRGLATIVCVGSNTFVITGQGLE